MNANTWYGYDSPRSYKFDLSVKHPLPETNYVNLNPELQNPFLEAVAEITSFEVWYVRSKALKHNPILKMNEDNTFSLDMDSQWLHDGADRGGNCR